MNKENKKKLATVFLMIGMFLNPLGFDAVQLMLIDLTGSYWSANLAMYCLAALFFGLYFLYSGNNPIKEVKDIIKNIYFDKIKHFKAKGWF
jgi:hypothetical protein